MNGSESYIKVLVLDKVLVTGGSGFIGSFLVERMVKDGYDVTVFDNNFRGRKSYLDEVAGKIKFITGDITKTEDIKTAVQGMDTIYHLAAVNGTEHFYKIPEMVLRVNMLGTINMLEALEGSDTGKFVYFSSSEIYGTPEYYPTDEKHKLVVSDPSNPRFTYSGSKIMGEVYTNVYCKKLGIDYSCVRPHNFYGPKMGYEHVIPQFITRIVKNQEFTIQGDGTQTRSYCFISDAIDALMKVGEMKTKGEAFNIGNDKEEISVLQLIEILSKIARVKVTPKVLPLLKGSTPRRKPDTSKIRKMLSYEPKVTLEEGLRITYDWYKKDLATR